MNQSNESNQNNQWTGDSEWKERLVIAECLKDVGYKKLAITASQEKIGTLSFYIGIIVKRALKLNKPEVLERLYFASLIYG